MKIEEAVEILEERGYHIELITCEFPKFEKYDNYPSRNKKADKYWKNEKTGK